MGPAGAMGHIRYTPIGTVHSEFKEPIGVPIQAAVAKRHKGRVVVFPEYADGLDDLEGFSHIILLFHCHKSRPEKLKVKPFLDDELRGIFATRSPSHPNPIGLSVVRLTKREGNILHIQDIDIIDSTPLLDIKPYIPDFDERDPVTIGWLTHKKDLLASVKDDARFA